MERVAPNIMRSLHDSGSGVCGFSIYNTQDSVSLAAEWSHSLNLFDIDISSVYEEVCERLAMDVGSVDVVVSCDKANIFIGFLANLRNRTRYMVVDSLATFYGTEGSALSGIVIDAHVWENMSVDGVRATLHIDKQSTSCCFRFSEWQEDKAHGLVSRVINAMVLVLAAVILMLAPHVLHLVWNGRMLEAWRMPICRYVVPIVYTEEQDAPFCSRHPSSTTGNGFFG
jgi:hypothetical protein